MPLNYVPRVTQLDAVHLDTQLEEVLKQQLYGATKFFEPGLLQPYLPEIELLIRSWIFKYSIYDKKSTFGQEMLSLYYKKDNFTRSKLWWYFGYTVGLSYLKDRSIYSYTSNSKLQSVIHNLENVQLIADVLNFLSFIQSGKYPVLIDLILGLEISADKVTRENLSDLSWTRELLWHNLIELIGTAVSLLNICGARQKFTSLLRFFSWKKPTFNGSMKNPSMNINTTCAHCSNKPVLPHTMGCSHIFCYYCLVANKQIDKNFQCPKCFYNGATVEKFLMT